MKAFICILLTISLCYIHAARLTGAKYRKLAIICDGRQRADLVLAASIKGLAANPFNVNLHGYAARALLNLKEHEPALMHANIMLKYYPNDLNALINASRACYYTGNVRAALNMRDRVKKIQPRYIK